MSETDPSPTPWKLSQGFGFSIEDAKGVPIAIVQEPVDAAHIVHCVNEVTEKDKRIADLEFALFNILDGYGHMTESVEHLAEAAQVTEEFAEKILQMAKRGAQ